MSNIDALKKELVDTVKGAGDIAALEEVRVTALGKKGKVTDMMKSLGALAPEERKRMGQALNLLKSEIAAEIEAKTATFKRAALEERLKNEKMDVTLSPRPCPQGTLHPITRTLEDITAIFADMGFSVKDGPEIEDDFHNFTALNFPPGHPARQMHDTFYLPDVPAGDGSEPTSGTRGKEGDAAKRLLRTHTSTVQVHVMQNEKPPLRVIIPGRTYRSDDDQTHTPMFHQIEGLMIDKTAHMGHLKGCLIELCKRFFEIDDLPTRFRPSFFPFTEPSAEMDIGCSRADGGLKIGKGAADGQGWLEILGCGMVHPNVLKNCGIDAEEYQGFAFGLGLERMAMLKYGIPDLRTFFESDLRWLKHYGFGPQETV